MPNPPPSTATVATASGGLGGSLVILILWAMSIWDVHMSTEQALAAMTVLTSATGFAWHLTTWWLARKGVPLPPSLAPAQPSSAAVSS